jgi:hypothetical protein
MTRRLLVFSLLSVIAVGGAASSRPAHSATADMNAQNHEAWLAGILKRIDSIKPGMTRADLLKVFRNDGQPSREMLALTGLRRTFISRDCPYFKVEVEFEPATHPDRGTSPAIQANSGGFEDAQDVIVKISKPYVEPPPAS